MCCGVGEMAETMGGGGVSAGVGSVSSEQKLVDGKVGKSYRVRHAIGYMMESFVFHVFLWTVPVFVGYTLAFYKPFSYFRPLTLRIVSIWVSLYFFTKKMAQGYDVDTSVILVKSLNKKMAISDAKLKMVATCTTAALVGLLFWFVKLPDQLQPPSQTLLDLISDKIKLHHDVSYKGPDESETLLAMLFAYLPSEFKDGLTQWLWSVLNSLNFPLNHIAPNSQWIPNISLLDPLFSKCIFSANDAFLLLALLIDCFLVELTASIIHSMGTALVLIHGHSTKFLTEHSLTNTAAALIIGYALSPFAVFPYLNLGYSIMVSVYRKDLLALLVFGGASHLATYIIGKSLSSKISLEPRKAAAPLKTHSDDQQKPSRMYVLPSTSGKFNGQKKKKHL